MDKTPLQICNVWEYKVRKGKVFCGSCGKKLSDAWI
jgi:hypothetical protein